MDIQLGFLINLRTFNFKSNQQVDPETSAFSDHIYCITVPYFGKESRRFINHLQRRINSKLNLILFN